LSKQHLQQRRYAMSPGHPTALPSAVGSIENAHQQQMGATDVVPAREKVFSKVSDGEPSAVSTMFLPHFTG